MSARYAKLVCTKCGWSKRVRRGDVTAELMGHRTVTCPERHLGELPSGVHTKGRWTSPPRSSALPGRKVAARCSTCGEPIRTVNDTRACATGCFYEAVAM